MFTPEKIAFQPFEKKVWLATPTMHGDELTYMTEAYATNWMSTVGENINEVERIAAEKALPDRGLSADIRESAPPSARRSDAGCVLRSVPPAGTRLEEGDSCMLRRTPPRHPSAVPRWSGLTLPPRAMRSPARGFPPGRCSSSPPRISSPAPSFLSRLPPPPSFPPERLSRCLSLSRCRKKRGIGERRENRKKGEDGEAPGDS